MLKILQQPKLIAIHCTFPRVSPTVHKRKKKNLEALILKINVHTHIFKNMGMVDISITHSGFNRQRLKLNKHPESLGHCPSSGILNNKKI
jgi:hypothetical protein